MNTFTIIETNNGLTVAEMGPGETPDEAAIRKGGFVVDPGPFLDYQEACDRLVAMRSPLADDADEADDQFAPDIE